MPEFPEHDRLAAISDQSQVISEFLEWAQGRGSLLAYYGRDGALREDHTRVDVLLAEFFDIDLGKIETEKRAMLDTIRKEVTR
jgi:hypothetical protein